MAALTLAPAALAAVGGKAGFSGAGPSVASAALPAASGEAAGTGRGPLAFSGFDLWALAAFGLLCGGAWLTLTALCATTPVRRAPARSQAAPARAPEVARA